MRSRWSLLALALLACGGDEAPAPPEYVASFDEAPFVCTQALVEEGIYGSGGTLANRYRGFFEIPEGTRAFMVNANFPGQTHIIGTLTAPDGERYDLLDTAEMGTFHPGVFSAYFGYALTYDRFQVPPTPAMADMVQAGRWTIEGDSRYDRFCYSVIPVNDAPNRIALEFLLADLDGLTAETIVDDPAWQATVARTEEIFAQTGVALDFEHATYAPLPDDVRTRYAVIRSQRDYQQLMSAVGEIETGIDEARRVRVILVTGFTGDWMGLLGIASGIPGALGAGGTVDNGIVFGVGGLLNDHDDWCVDYGYAAPCVGVERSPTDYLAAVIAHELGHYAGLFHTTETFVDLQDPLDDTPECTDLYLGTVNWRSCPDESNLMFPIISPLEGELLTEEQAATVRASVIARE